MRRLNETKSVKEIRQEARKYFKMIDDSDDDRTIAYNTGFYAALVWVLDNPERIGGQNGTRKQVE